MSFNVQLSKKAQTDINEIVDYLSLFGKQAVQNFLDSFENQLNILGDGVIDYSLSKFPHLAKLGYHSVFFNNYVLLYYEEGRNRIVSHVFHQSQNYTNLV